MWECFHSLLELSFHRRHSFFAAPHIYRRATHANNTSVYPPPPTESLHSRKRKVWLLFFLFLFLSCSHVSVAEVQDSVPPTMEAITTPRITQHIMIIIFFCGVLTTRGDGRPTQQRNRGKHIRAMNPALCAWSDWRKMQLGGTETVLLVRGNHLESPAAAFCYSRVQKQTNHFKFKASARAKWENNSFKPVCTAKKGTVEEFFHD